MSSSLFSPKNLRQDLPAGLVTFLVALPLCLGIALASGAPLFSGILAGVIGGIVVGILSGSPTSVSGPAAGLAAIVVTQIELFGSFQTFLLAVFLAGVAQLGLGLLKAGSLASFFPSSVIRGLLAAIGLLLILKQLPHLVGHDPDPIGEMQFLQPDHQSTFSELQLLFRHIQPGAVLIGLMSLFLLIGWDRLKVLKRSGIPVPLLVVGLGTGIQLLLASKGHSFTLSKEHLVQVPVLDSLGDVGSLVVFPDFSAWTDPRVYLAAATIAIVASLETLLNLDAVDNLDPKKRTSPTDRELLAQGAGNMLGGLLGALPVTSVVVRSSVNVQAGNATKMSTIFHGLFLILCVFLIPQVLNLIPLASLAAILIVTGFKLASPNVIKQVWSEGKAQFIPFAVTVVAIVFSDLLTGVLLGLATSIGFILHSNLSRPLKKVVEKHVAGEVLRIELGEQVSFLNRAALENTLNGLEHGSQIILDARGSSYIDPDVLHLVREFKDVTAEIRSIQVSLLGFKDHYSQLPDTLLYEDFVTREVQTQLTPAVVLDLLVGGNQRFLTGHRLHRDWNRQITETAKGQAPLAVVLSCIDSRNSSELIFDLGIGDIFSVRIAGNVARSKVIGSIEYACAVAGAKLIVVMGHTSCGAVNTAVQFYGRLESTKQATGCSHLNVFLDAIQQSIDPQDPIPKDEEGRRQYADLVAARHVQRTLTHIVEQSDALASLVTQGKVGIIGALYDVNTGKVTFFPTEGPLQNILDAHKTKEPARAKAPAPSPINAQTEAALLP